jgi:hypothetical protein
VSVVIGIVMTSKASSSDEELRRWIRSYNRSRC